MASLLPNGKQHFDDNNGRPLVGGRVYYYIPNTSTPKNTWQDQAMTVLNANPIILDARGECTAWGVGSYRQVVRDSFGNLIWDRIVSDLSAVIDEVVADFAAPNGSSLVGFTQRGGGAVPTTVEKKAREWVSILDFGGSPLNTSAQNDAALTAAFTVCRNVLVPATEDGSEYRLTTPMALPYTLALFGDSTLVFDNAEWWRRGGSAGAGLQEKYTLFFDYTDQSDVSVTFDGVAQTITFPSPFTVLAPASTTSTAVRINIANGRLALGPSPEQARSFNVLNNGGENVSPSLPDPLTSPVGMMNTATGARALFNLTTGENCTAYGARALLSVTSGNNQTAFGFQTLYRSLGSDNTAFGSVAGEWLESGEQNVFVGGAAANHSITASYNTAVGWFAMGDNQAGNYNTCLGWRAGGNTGPDHSFSESVMAGAFAGSFSWGGKNTYMGYRAGTGLNSGSDGFENVAIGFFSMREHNGADMNVAVGVSALQQVVNGQQNVAIGHSAGNAILGNIKNTLLGYRAGVAVVADGNTLVGADAAATTTTGTGNAALGSGTLATNVSGINNTALGNNSGRLLQSGGGTVNLNNTTTVGFDARVSGSDQVQLGNGATTTYVYGTVQNRSDRRDKADIQDTVLGLEFIKALRPVDYKWDMREDYAETAEYSVEVEEEYEEATSELGADGLPLTIKKTRMVQEVRHRVIHHERDGSKKRTRHHHGLISQEVKEVADRLGVDFGGFQDHTVNGGCDVQSLGYDEFIAPLIRAVQELAARVAELETRP